MMNSIDVLLNWLADRGYRPLHAGPLPEEGKRREYWTTANKHGDMTVRDADFLRQYALIALSAGSPFMMTGIKLGHQGYVHPDRAVMNSCFNAGLVDIDEGAGVFVFTIKAYEKLGWIG
jgi:hypothetical protein